MSLLLLFTVQASVFGKQTKKVKIKPVAVKTER